MNLPSLLALPIVLPSIPKIIALLLSELDRAEPDLQQITELISSDLALTTRLLKYANAGYFQMSGKISSASEALAILGMSHIRAIASEAASDASLKSLPGIQLQQFWAYSLYVARLSRLYAGLIRHNPVSAFTCGLVHGVGELMMHAGMPSQMALMNMVSAPLHLKRGDAEIAHFGFSYAQASGAYARKWLFPRDMVDALENFDAPFQNNVYEPLSGIVHLAAWRARAELDRLTDSELSVTFPSMVGEVLDLDMDTVLQQSPFDWSAVVR